MAVAALYIADEKLTKQERLAIRLLISRKASGLTQAQIGIRLGMDQQQISYHEINGTLPGWMLSDWARITGQNISFFQS